MQAPCQPGRSEATAWLARGVRREARGVTPPRATASRQVRGDAAPEAPLRRTRRPTRPAAATWLRGPTRPRQRWQSRSEAGGRSGAARWRVSERSERLLVACDGARCLLGLVRQQAREREPFELVDLLEFVRLETGDQALLDSHGFRPVDVEQLEQGGECVA